MKKYNCGGIEIKNIEVLRREFDEDLQFIGIQRSLAHFDTYTNENTDELIFDGIREKENDGNVIKYTYENCDFELPLLDKWGNMKGVALIGGTGKDIREIDEDGNEEDLEVYFNIEQVNIVKKEFKD